MKKIGTTDQGTVLLEASQDEYSMLVHLAAALEGKPLEDVRFSRQEIGVMPDYYGAFGAIEAFALELFRINELVALTHDLKNAVLRGYKDKG